MAHKTIEIPQDWFRAKDDVVRGERPAAGSPATILAVIQRLPRVEPTAVDELEAAIRLGRMAPRFDAEFD